MSNENINDESKNKRKKFTGRYIVSTPEKLYVEQIKNEEEVTMHYCYFLNIEKVFSELQGLIGELTQGDEIEFEAVESNEMDFNGYKIESPKHIRKLR